MVGVSEGTFESAGEKSPVKWTVAWAPGNQCLVIHEEYNVDDVPSKLTALMGYDRIKKQMINLGFRTDGGNRTLTYDAGHLSGKITGDNPDGQIISGKFIIDKSDEGWSTIKFTLASPAAADFVIRLRKAKS